MPCDIDKTRIMMNKRLPRLGSCEMVRRFFLLWWSYSRQDLEMVSQFYLKNEFKSFVIIFVFNLKGFCLRN